MPTEFDTPKGVQWPDLSGLPDDVTPEELAGTLFGRPIVRDGVEFMVDLQLTDQLIEDLLADAGVVFEDE